MTACDQSGSQSLRNISVTIKINCRDPSLGVVRERTLAYGQEFRGLQNQRRSQRVTKGTFLFPPAALQFAYGHPHYKPEVPLHAMRDDGRALRLRKILLPLPIADGSPPLRRRPVLLQALPGSLQLPSVRFGFGSQLLGSGPRVDLSSVSDGLLRDCVTCGPPAHMHEAHNLDHHCLFVFPKHFAHTVGDFADGGVGFHGGDDMRHEIGSRAGSVLDLLQ
jgi:hypothetical protein